jgi:hypothetical protein
MTSCRKCPISPKNELLWVGSVVVSIKILLNNLTLNIAFFKLTADKRKSGFAGLAERHFAETFLPNESFATASRLKHDREEARFDRQIGFQMFQ